MNADIPSCRSVSPADLFDLKLVSDPQISPCGTEAVFVVQRSSVVKNAYFSNLWLTSVDGTQVRALTHGDQSDSAPRWSPDGAAILFSSNRGEKSGLWRLPREGGEAEPLIQIEDAAIGEFVSLRDGSALYFTIRATPPWSRKTVVEERKQAKKSTPPLVVNRLSYRTEGCGYFGDELWRLMRLDLGGAGAEPVEIIALDRDVQGFDVNAEGDRIAFTCGVGPDPDMNLQLEEIRVLHVASGEIRTLGAPAGPKGGVRWSPDGRMLAYLAHTDTRDAWSGIDSHLWVFDLDSGESRDLMAELDRPAGDCTLADLCSFGAGFPFQWSADSRSLFSLVSDRGASHLYRIPTDGAGPINLTSGFEGVISGVSVAADSSQAVIVAGAPMRPNDVHRLDLAGESTVWSQLSDLNAGWLAAKTVRPVTEVLCPSPEGLVHGWLIIPEGDGPHPLVLYIHGGPHTQYGWSMVFEFQCLAAAGLAVLYTNPRGSRGYGSAHSDAIRGDWGGPDYRDLMAAVEHVAARPDIDDNRLGVTGGSYGGYMTNWIVGHTNRFKCALTQRSVTNLHSMGGTCDFNFSDTPYFGGNTWADPQNLLRQSPLMYAAAVETPLMILHSEGDLRCPIEQAEQWFAALKRLGKQVEFVRYPREANHGLSRSGPPDLRLDRLERILGWFRRYLVRAE